MRTSAGLPLSIKNGKLVLGKSLIYDKKFVRAVTDLKPVLFSKPKQKTAYSGYQNVRKKAESTRYWHNLTVFSKQKLGKEYNKSHGHYQSVREIYQVYQGMCGMLIQRGKKVTFVVAFRGDAVLIPERCLHVIYNLGDSLLVLGDLVDNDLREMFPADYKNIRKMKGAPYYVIEKLKFMRNKKYPRPKTFKHVGLDVLYASNLKQLTKQKLSLLELKQNKNVQKFLSGAKKFNPLLDAIYGKA